MLFFLRMLLMRFIYFGKQLHPISSKFHQSSTVAISTTLQITS